MAKTEKTPFCGRALVRVSAKIEKKYPFGRLLVTNREKKYTLFTIRAKLEKKNLCGRALVRVKKE